MNIFLSWSGDKSKLAAEAFNDWIRCVLQSVKPWISTSGIEGGSIWFEEISTRLSDSSVGIIFLTQSNKDSPWIMFEAGALAKGLKKSRVVALLIDLKSQDITNPLANFNHATIEKSNIFKVLAEFNSMMGENALLYSVLEKVFEKNWPDLEEKLNEIKQLNIEPTPPTTKRNNNDKMDEILLNTRQALRRVDRLERELYLNKVNNKHLNDLNSLRSTISVRDLNKMISDNELYALLEKNKKLKNLEVKIKDNENDTDPDDNIIE
ncbi:toll/interleukin-1 receptor domain-containing protein [Vreelandella sp.]|uniref:toll/interleukin-1 receptor domain-containing protein n=1 Tax=Vreelandella sp. TaxID=3137778 RepID=UPI003BAAE4B1